jgi:predicted TIM-barrel fold metal-dependent hydrolase
MVVVNLLTHIIDEKMVSPKLKELLNKPENKGRYFTATSDRLVQEMDESGIDWSVVSFWDSSPYLGIQYPYDMPEWNDFTGESCAKFPDRLMAFFAIDPRRGEVAIQEMERCVQKYGMKGAKMMPSGRYPNDKLLYPFYKRAEELQLVLLFHQGAFSGHNPIKCCRPIYLDDVAKAFPKLKIVGLHMGEPWVEEMAYVARSNENVWVDISYIAWVLYKQLRPEFHRKMGYFKAFIGDKIMFSTDWPTSNSYYSMGDCVGIIKNLRLPQSLKDAGLDEWTDEEKRRILGENALKLLGLK